MPDIINAISQNGIYYSPFGIPSDALSSEVTNNSYRVISKRDMFVYPPPSSIGGSITNVFSGSKQIQESFFGLHVQLPENIPRAVKSLRFYSIRSHDSGYGLRWHSLNPSNGVFIWDNADAWINACVQEGKEIIFTLGFTPDWASASTPNNGKYDNGITARATNQPPSNVAYWDSYCSAVATRYAGKIKIYEIWNEVNYPSYWNGTAAQLAVLVRRANQIIKAIDPQAVIVAPIVQEPESSGTGNAYLQSFLDAGDGNTGTGKLWIDVCGIHMYPPIYNFQIHKNQIDNVKATLAARSLSIPIWNTETGILEPSYGVVDEVRAKYLMRSLLLSAALGVDKYFWYSYDNSAMYMRQSQIEAWAYVRNLLLSAPIVGCNLAKDGTVAITIGSVNLMV